MCDHHIIAVRVDHQGVVNAQEEGSPLHRLYKLNMCDPKEYGLLQFGENYCAVGCRV